MHFHVAPHKSPRETNAATTPSTRVRMQAKILIHAPPADATNQKVMGGHRDGSVWKAAHATSSQDPHVHACELEHMHTNNHSKHTYYPARACAQMQTRCLQISRPSAQDSFPTQRLVGFHALERRATDCAPQAKRAERCPSPGLCHASTSVPMPPAITPTPLPCALPL